MFLRLFYYFTLVPLLVISFRVFSAPCGNSFSSFRLKGIRSAIGIESYKQALERLAKSSLRVKSLNMRQIKALETYHHVVQGEVGKDGTFARAGNYTVSQIRKIMRFLETEFSPEQVKTLIENGVVEVNRIDLRVVHRRVLLKVFSERKMVFLLGAGLHNEIIKVRKVLQQTNDGLLLEVDKLSVLSDHLVSRRKIFFTPWEYTNDVGQILERTDQGFVIYQKGHLSKSFFSFEEGMKNGLLPEKPTAEDHRELEDMLTSFLSHNGNGINFQLESRIENSVIFGQSYDAVIGNSEIGTLFLANQSTRKKLAASTLNLPPSTNKEIQLAEQGYKANYTAEIDRVNEWVALRRQFQELKVNPWTTHIEYFADKIPGHIAHIRKGLEDNYFSDIENGYDSKSDQLLRLNNLEGEAKKIISDKKVTYKWWLEFNSRLAAVMSGGSAKLGEHTMGVIDTNLSHFPLRVVIPTTTGENIGIMAFNRANIEGIYPAGLINKPITEVDGGKMDSIKFFLHDFAHTLIKGNQIYLGYSTGPYLFHKRLLHNIESLPLEKRKKAEVVYFLMTHEYEASNISYSNWTLKQMREEVMRVINTDTPRIFKISDDSAQKEEKIKDFVDAFMEVYIQTLQHQ